MKLYFDREADALLFEFRAIGEGGVTETKHVSPGINLLLGPDGDVLAIEVLNLSRMAGRPVLEHLEMDIAPPPQGIESDVELPPEVEAWLREQQTKKKSAKIKA